MRIFCLSLLCPFPLIAGNKYYYNTANGESSWQIPGAKEEVKNIFVVVFLQCFLCLSHGR